MITNGSFAKGFAKLGLPQSSILCWTHESTSNKRPFVSYSRRKTNEGFWQKIIHQERKTGAPIKAELDRQRDEITVEAFNVLSQSLTKAIEALTGLLDNQDDRLKRLTAKDIIDFILRHKENEDLDKRLTEVEKCLEKQ